MPQSHKDKKEKTENKSDRRHTRATTEDESGDTSLDTTNQSSNVATGKESGKTQVTIEKMLKPVKLTENLEETLKSFNDKLNKVASQEYIELKFRKLITTEFLNEKLDKFKNEINEEITKRIREEVNSISGQISEMRNTVCSVQTDIEKLKNQVSDLEESRERIENQNSRLKNKCHDLEEKFSELKDHIYLQSLTINELEQYTRKNSIRIYGMPDTSEKESSLETRQKVMDMLNNKLGMKVTERDFDMVHRLGRFSKDADRPVICKFMSRYHKQEAVAARKNLKGSALIIREDLTYKNAKLLELASRHEDVKNAWSDDGKIIVSFEGIRRKMVITHKTDLERPLLTRRKNDDGTETLMIIGSRLEK